MLTSAYKLIFIIPVIGFINVIGSLFKIIFTRPNDDIKKDLTYISSLTAQAVSGSLSLYGYILLFCSAGLITPVISLLFIVGSAVDIIESFFYLAIESLNSKSQFVAPIFLTKLIAAFCITAIVSAWCILLPDAWLSMVYLGAITALGIIKTNVLALFNSKSIEKPSVSQPYAQLTYHPSLPVAEKNIAKKHLRFFPPEPPIELGPEVVLLSYNCAKK